jgi:hypothetical protein
MRLAEFDKALAEARIERDQEIAAWKHIKAIFESLEPYAHPLRSLDETITDSAEIDSLMKQYKWLGVKAKNMLLRGHFSERSAESAAKSMLAQAIWKLDPKFEGAEQTSYLQQTVIGLTLNLIAEEKPGNLAMAIGKGKQSEDDAKAIRLFLKNNPSVRLNKTVDGEDGESTELIHSIEGRIQTSAEDEYDEKALAKKLPYLASMWKKKYLSEPEDKPTKMIAMVFDRVKDGDFGDKGSDDDETGKSWQLNPGKLMGDLAKDWYKWDIKNKVLVKDEEGGGYVTRKGLKVTDEMVEKGHNKDRLMQGIVTKSNPNPNPEKELMNLVQHSLKMIAEELQILKEAQLDYGVIYTRESLKQLYNP